MTEHTIRISNSETGEVIDRPMTEEEIAEHELITAEVLAEAKAKEDLEARKAAVITKLGLTADEVFALLA
jgi:hypothetical protein